MPGVAPPQRGEDWRGIFRMANSKRDGIITAIDTRMKTIKTTAGYETGIGTNVNWWLMAPLDPDSDLPAICLKDRDRIEWSGIGEHLHSLEISAEIYIKPTYTAAAGTMRKAIADMIKCIGVDVTWGGLAQDTLLPPEDNLTIEQQEYCLIAVGFKFVVQFLTNAWDPYNYS